MTAGGVATANVVSVREAEAEPAADAMRLAVGLRTSSLEDSEDVGARIARTIARGQHREAVGLCAREYGAALGRLCQAFLGSQAEAEEAVQETLVAALDAFPQFRAEGSVKAFLYGIARRRCARALEQRTQHDARARLARPLETSVGDASDLVMARQRAEKTRVALGALRPTEREAVLLRYQGGLSFREVATACGCDEATARKRVSRALARLRETLADD